jgi:hypothetical protein
MAMMIAPILMSLSICALDPVSSSVVSSGRSKQEEFLMGCWGVEAWANDAAADWFGDLWERFPVPLKVEETLQLDRKDNHEEIRAAAYVLLQLADTYVWPIASIDRHCDLAARRLEELKGMEIYAGDSFQAQLQKEIDALRSRISEDFKNNRH